MRPDERAFCFWFAREVFRWWLAVVVVLCFMLDAKAAGTVDPSGTSQYKVDVFTYSTGWVGDPGTACALAAQAPTWCTSSYTSCGVDSYTSQVCNARRSLVSNGQVYHDGSFSIQTRAGNTCPSNATLSADGTTCSCNANFQPSTDHKSCVPIPDACNPTLAKPLGSPGQEFSYPVSAKVVPSRVCSNGCGYIPSGAAGSGAALWTKLGSTFTYVARSAADWIGDGLSCTPAPVGSPGTPPTTPPQPDPTPPPSGKCKGTVNGVEVIVSCDSTSTSSGTQGAGSEASGPPSTASSPAGTTPNTGGKTSDTTCTGTSCTTTTTTTTNNPNGTTTTTTGTETEDKGDFCSEHPGNPQCEEETDPCKDAADTLACLKVGTVPTPAAITATTVTAAITPQSGWGADNGSCPALVHTTKLGNVDVFGLFCTYAAGIRFAVIGFAFMVAVLIFLGRTD